MTKPRFAKGDSVVLRSTRELGRIERDATLDGGEFWYKSPYDKRKLISYVKALIAYLLGIITFSLAAIAIGTIIDLIIQK